MLKYSKPILSGVFEMKKMLRRLSAYLFIMAIVVSTLSQTVVFASTNTYDLAPLGLEVTIPPEYTVITRDTPENDPIFDALGITKADVIGQFEAGNIYLNALSTFSNEEMVVTMQANSLTNFSLLSDTVLSTLAASLASQYTDYGIHVSQHETYQHSQAKFIKLHFTDTANTVHGLQFYTIYDGKAISFTMRSYTGSLSPGQETAIQMVVDSIKFDQDPPAADPGEDTASFTYTDADSGVAFTLPSNWKQEAFTEEREFIDVKFCSTKEDGCMILFGSTDLWEQIPASERAGYSRADITNSVFTKAVIAEMYNTSSDKISEVTYNGVSYYKGEIAKTSDVYGFDLSVTMTQLARFHNGWLYTFCFGGTSEHPLFSDFESLLNSAQYPAASTAADLTSAASAPSGIAKARPHVGAPAIIIAILLSLAVIGVVVAIVLVSRKKKTKAAHDILFEIPAYQPATPPVENTAPALFCQNCGQSLPQDSKFCHVCGTKINAAANDIERR